MYHIQTPLTHSSTNVASSLSTPSSLKLHTFPISENAYLLWTMSTLHLQNASHHIRLHLAEFLSLPTQTQLDFILSNPRPKSALYPFALYLPLSTSASLSSTSASLLLNNPLHPLSKAKPSKKRISLNLLFEAALLYALQTHYPQTILPTEITEPLPSQIAH